VEPKRPLNSQWTHEYQSPYDDDGNDDDDEWPHYKPSFSAMAASGAVESNPNWDSIHRCDP
jgi:hypothetical protein